MLSFRSLATVLSSVVAATGVAATVAPTASAAQLCREVSSNGYSYVIACVVADHNASGLTVAPEVWIGCAGFDYNLWCEIDPISLDKTGYDPAAVMPTIDVDRTTLTVSSSGGSVGTLWVAGTAVPLNLPPFCIGDPSIC